MKPSSYLILGLVRTGFSSGYAIRRAIEDMDMLAFWSTSLAQIYPELSALEKAGHVTRREDHHGARTRMAYELTPQGEDALMAWLRDLDFPPMDVHDEGLLRLGFGDMLPPEDALALVAEMRRRAEEAERTFREINVPMAEAARAGGYRFPAVIARMGAAYHAWAAEYLAGVERELALDLELAQDPR